MSASTESILADCVQCTIDAVKLWQARRQPKSDITLTANRCLAAMNVMDAVAVELEAIGWIGMASKSLTLSTPALMAN